MEIFIMVIGIKIIQTTKGNIFLLKIEDLIKENGKMAFSKEKVYKTIKMAQSILDNFQMG